MSNKNGYYLSLAQATLQIEFCFHGGLFATFQKLFS